MIMNKWEYHVVDGSENSDHVERMCNELGTKGWELAGTSPILMQYDRSGFGEAAMRTDWLMIFKRRARQESAAPGE
jgi:hypothetical protein